MKACWPTCPRQRRSCARGRSNRSYTRKITFARTGGRPGTGAAIKRALAGLAIGLLQPDPQILWNAPAFIAGIRALRRVHHDVIVASAPPFSSLLLGAALSAATGTPLVLDYRDEWDVSNRYWEHRRVRAASLAIQRGMERYALRTRQSRGRDFGPQRGRARPTVPPRRQLRRGDAHFQWLRSGGFFQRCGDSASPRA
jgi:hypothetical protein